MDRTEEWRANLIALGLIIVLPIALGIFLSETFGSPLQRQIDEDLAVKREFYASCLDHEPRYRCDYLWDDMTDLF